MSAVPRIKASLVHHYDDPKDAIIAPHKFMALTHYYVDRWLPELGERGHVIVTVLRRMGYLDRERDVKRGGIEIEQEELAILCGLKLRTFQREFATGDNDQPFNPALHRFVQREQQYHRNGTGRVVREKTVYVVQMRDPLHPSDQTAFQDECEQREKNREKTPGDACTRQCGGTSRHIGGNNKVILDSYIPLLPLDDASGVPGVLPSAFPGRGTRVLAGGCGEGVAGELRSGRVDEDKGKGEDEHPGAAGDQSVPGRSEG